MNKDKKIASAALAGIISVALANIPAQSAIAAPNDVKCYGIAKAGKNDCGTIIGACAATVKQEKACYAWIYMPKGICAKISGASIGKPAADCKGPNGQPVKE